LQVTSIVHRVLEHRIRAVVALLVFAFAAVGVAACGSSGGSGGGSGDAQGLLKQTFSGVHTIKSGKAKLQLNLDLQGVPQLNGPIKLGVTGPFQSVGGGQLPKFDLAVNVGAQGQSIQAGLTSTSDRLFVQFGGTAYEVPAKLVTQLKQSMKSSQQQSSAAKSQLDLGSLHLDPLSWLKDAKVEGTETVGGTQTQHVSAQLDTSAFLDDVDKVLGQVAKKGLPNAGGQTVPSSIPDKVRQQILDAVKSGTIDVWTGTSDKTLRKISVALSIEPKNPGSGLKSAQISFSLELEDLNTPQTIATPASPKPLNELLGQLGGLLGGVDGGALGGALGGVTGQGQSGGGGPQTTPVPSGGQTAQVQKYANCIKAAGSDLTKAQQCAQLLTK
jgi:hypothetical protein